MSLRTESRCPRTRRYAAAGAALASGAPLGLLLVQALRAGVLPTFEWASAHVASEAAVYAYVTLSTMLVFTAFGWVVGSAADRLDATSLTDSLTGLGNRRKLDRRLSAELARSARYGTPLTFVLIDVDGLKTINDHAGHSAGDLALQRVAAAIAATARRTDSAARIGGDEFALVAPGTTAEEALALAERIRMRVLDESAGTLSVSIGLADLGHTTSLDAEALFRAADRALYTSKSSGRDRVSAPPQADEATARRGSSSRAGVSEAPSGTPDGQRERYSR